MTLLTRITSPCSAPCRWPSPLCRRSGCPLKEDADSPLDSGALGRLPVGRALRLALACLTRLPIRLGDAETGPLSGTMHLFPLVGVVVGALGAVVYALAASCLPPTLAALLAVGTTALVTGAMHEDGLSDVADGFGGGATRERKLEIMKDSRIGSYGGLMLILGVSLRVGALAALASPWAVAAALIVAHALGRAAIPVAMQGLAPARSQGLGATVGQPSPSTAGIAATWAMAIAWLILPNGTAAAAVVAVTLAATGLASLALRQIGGQTGDVLGAIEQSGEIAALLAIVAMA